MEKRKEARPHKHLTRVTVSVLFLISLTWLTPPPGTAQELSVHFINSAGETIATIAAHREDSEIYLPVDAVKQVFDPRTSDRYNLPRKRLTLKTNGQDIHLQIGSRRVTIDPGGQTYTLSAPPILIGQQPMLPLTFFTQLLPTLNNLEAIYTPSLKRVQLRPKAVWTPNLTPAAENWVIIVDPGHGGETDRGCESSTGLLEKDIVLRVAKQIKQLGETQGLRVILTRQTDEKRTYAARAQIAKRYEGQLFLSLHCNASFSPDEKGIEIYLNSRGGELRTPNSTTSTATADRLTVLDRPDFLRGSREFAHALQTELDALTDTPVKITELPLVTLAETYMPAVVLELGYLTNVADLENLSNAEYLAGVAQAIVRALQRQTPSEKAPVLSTGPDR